MARFDLDSKYERVWGRGSVLAPPVVPPESARMFTLIMRALGLHTYKMYAHGTAEEVSAKWLSRLQQAQADMTAGVARVTVAPGQAAAAKKTKWINALQDPATQDKWARNVASVSLSQWQQAMTNYGVARVAQGAQAKQQKFTNAMTSLLAYIDQGVNQVRQMDDTNPAAREQRALAMMRWMRNYKRPAGS